MAQAGAEKFRWWEGGREGPVAVDGAGDCWAESRFLRRASFLERGVASASSGAGGGGRGNDGGAASRNQHSDGRSLRSPVASTRTLDIAFRPKKSGYAVSIRQGAFPWSVPKRAKNSSSPATKSELVVPHKETISRCVTSLSMIIRQMASMRRQSAPCCLVAGTAVSQLARLQAL